MNKKMLSHPLFSEPGVEITHALAAVATEAADRIRLLETLLDIFVDARDMNEESDGEIWINTWKALASQQKDISPEFVKIVEENFWELLA